MTTTNKLTSPADLDPTRLHSPSERRQWEAGWAAYRDTVREEGLREQLKRAAAEADANRPLNEDEYFALAVQRHAEAQVKLAEREAEEKAKQDAEAAYLASLPDTADVMEKNEYTFLCRLQHWLSQGYSVSEDSLRWWAPGLYHVTLSKPVATGKRSA